MKKRLLRIPDDVYYTPDWVTDYLMESLSYSFWGSNPVILDPCKGTGTMQSRIKEHLQNAIYYASDLEQGNRFDATKADYWEKVIQTPDWVITNPPYKNATAILNHSLNHSKIGVTMILRLNYLEPCKNRFQTLTHWEDNLRFLMPLNPRPKFRNDTRNSDSVTSCWFVWDKRHSWEKLNLKCPFIFN